jgi:hypothetical protein
MSRMKLPSLVVGLLLVMAGGALAQTITTVEKAQVEIVQVSGNTVMFLLNGEVWERTVPADFRVMVDGQPVPVSALVPGQKVMIEKTSTTRVVPPSKVVTVRQGVVLNVVARTLQYKENGEVKKVVIPPDFKFMRDGKSVGLDELRPGDGITATLVTESPGGSSATEATVKASAQAPKAPAPAPAPAAAPAAAVPAAAPAPAPTLPKTASSFPLLGMMGGLLLVLGAGLALARRLF